MRDWYETTAKTNAALAHLGGLWLMLLRVRVLRGAAPRAPLFWVTYLQAAAMVDYEAKGAELDALVDVVAGEWEHGAALLEWYTAVR